MGWKATGHPVVRQQRGRWVVRVDGFDTETGKQRPRQLGTYPSRRAADAAARAAAAGGPIVGGKGTVGWLVRRWVESRTDVGARTKEQYEWALPHIEAGLGKIPLERLDRDDVAAWLDALATGGRPRGAVAVGGPQRPRRATSPRGRRVFAPRRRQLAGGRRPAHVGG